MAASASVVDVAARAGVSVGTVSNVLNRPDRVALGTRERVQRAIDELGFVRNEAARQLRAGHSRTLGLVVLDVGNPFFTDVAAGVETCAAGAELSVVLCNSNDDVTREQHYLTMLTEQRAFGVLITPVGDDRTAIERVRGLGTPVVLVDRPGTADQCSVAVDDVRGGQLAVEHLVALGHRRIGFVGGPVAINQVAERLTGARSAWAAAGRADADLTVVESSRLDAASGRWAGAHLQEMPAATRPSAVLCANDLIALGVLQDAVARRLAVPDDLAIVGYDDIEFASAAAVPLTSVRQPRAELGRAATELLLSEVEHADSHEHRRVVFEPELVVRESTVREARTTAGSGR